MSETDSFIEEVTEEVRRDRLFKLFRRYGWIGITLVLLIVGGAAWNEYAKAQERAKAEALGDSILAALEAGEPGERIGALEAIAPESAGGRAVLGLLKSAEQDSADAAETLGAIARDGEVPDIFRDIASFKRLLHVDALEADVRRAGFEALSRPGNPLRLLAEEQLALIEIDAGETDAALARFRAILEDSEVSTGLRQRVSQAIVALGGETDTA